MYIPKDSVLRPILFNVILTTFSSSSSSEDTGLFPTLQIIPNLIPVILAFNKLLIHLEHDSLLAVCWFESKYTV